MNGRSVNGRWLVLRPKCRDRMNQNEFNKKLWTLGREVHTGKCRLAPVDVGTIYHTSKNVRVPKIFGRQNGTVEVFQSDSMMSAWLHRPWRYNKKMYPGMQYKGVNLEGLYRPARDVIALETANLEYCFSRFANDNGVTCQLPLLTYGVCRRGLSMGVLVRSLASPLTLLELHQNKKLFEKYLSLRGERREEYFEFMARTLGRSVRRLFDVHLCKGDMTLDKITSEGELIDFEPALDLSFNGVVLTELPNFRSVMLERLFSSIFGFVEDKNKFTEYFSHAFFDKHVRISPKRYVEDILRRYYKLK